MSFTTTKTILKYASDHSIAHPAFNVNMPCQAEAIIEACEEIRSACIIQVAEPGLAFIGGNPDFLNGTMEEKKRGAKLIANAVKRRFFISFFNAFNRFIEGDISFDKSIFG